MKDFFELAQHRESCRVFDKEKTVDNALVEKCIMTARLSASACNSQPWSFVVENGSDKRQQVLDGIQAYGMNKFTNKCPAFIVVVEEEARIISGTKWELLPDQKYAKFDIGFSVAHICFAAVELGLSTCILGAVDSDAIKKALDIDESKNITVVIAIGYAAKDKLRDKVRKEPEEIMRFV